jgi:RNA polymerase sigma-70 factor (ECF subfamily)
MWSPDAEFTAVYRAEVATLVRHVMVHGATAEEAWDAAQTAFAEAYRVWATVRSPRAWLRVVAVRAHFRSAVPETPTDTPPDRPDPSSPALRVELGEQERFVLAALAGLPVKQRQVMAWTVDGYAPAEIAAVLEENPAAVRQNLRRARQNLKQRLGISGRTRDDRL